MKTQKARLLSLEGSKRACVVGGGEVMTLVCVDPCCEYGRTTLAGQVAVEG
ncbi:MAG: hypothetical protein IJP82_09430 [Bacteroidaceae bacterium]|nr:hypothetical protein [Bacteroidaceae bacterium]